MPISREPKEQRQGDKGKDPNAEAIALAQKNDKKEAREREDMRGKQDKKIASDQAQRDQELADRADKAAKELHEEMKHLGKEIGGQTGEYLKRSKDFERMNKNLIKGNADLFNKKAQGFFKNADKMNVLGASANFSDVIEDQLKKLIDVGNSAATASVDEIKKLRVTSLSALKSLEIVQATDDSQELADLVKMAKEQYSALKNSTGVLDSIDKSIGGILSGGLGKLVEYASFIPGVNTVIGKIEDASDTKKENRATVIESQVQTMLDLRKEQIKAEGQFNKELPERIGNRIQDAYEKVMTDVVPADATQDEMNQGLLQVSASLDKIMQGDKESAKLFSSWLNKSEEERREMIDRENDKLSIFERMADALESLSGKEEEDPESIMPALTMHTILQKALGWLKAGAFLFVGTLMKVVVGIPKAMIKLITKMLPKLISRFFAPLAIIGALFSGISDAIDEYAKSGNIWKAVQAGLAGILDFITFGLIDEEMGKKIFGEIGKVFGEFTTWLGDMIGLHGEDMKEIVRNAWSWAIESIQRTWDNFLADIQNIGEAIANLQWVQKLMDILGPIFDWVFKPWIEAFELVAKYSKELWDTVLKDKWDAVVTGLTNLFDWIADLFTIDNLRKLAGDGIIADTLFGKKERSEEELNSMTGKKRAEISGAVNFNWVGDSNIEDMFELNKLNHNQLRELIDMNDWSPEDGRQLRIMYKKKLEAVTTDAVAKAGPMPKQDDKQYVQGDVTKQKLEILSSDAPMVKEEKKPTNEMVKGPTAAAIVDQAEQEQRQIAMQEAEKKEANQRRAEQAAGQNKTIISSRSQTNNTSVSSEKPWDTDQSAARYENANYSG